MTAAASGLPAASPLVSPQWLAAHLEDPGLRILDARWVLRCVGGRERARFYDGSWLEWSADPRLPVEKNCDGSAHGLGLVQSRFRESPPRE